MLLVTAVTDEMVGLPHNVVTDAIVAFVPEQVGVDNVAVTDRFCPLFKDEIKYGLLVIRSAVPVPAPVQLRLYWPDPNGEIFTITEVEVTLVKVTVGVTLGLTTTQLDDTSQHKVVLATALTQVFTVMLLHV